MINLHRKSILRLLEALKRLQANPLDLALSLNLQLDLAKKMVQVESRIRIVRTALQKARALAKLGRTTKDASRRRKLRVVREANRLDSYRRLLHNLKAIGDGIAFLYFSRWDIKPMGYRQTSGFIAGKEGHGLERRILRAVIRQDVPAVICDLTNSLRFGDTLVAYGDSPRFFEVKKGRDHPLRLERQMNAVKGIADYLRTDQADNLFDLGHARRVALSFEPAYDTDLANSIIASAYASPHRVAAGNLSRGVSLLASLDKSRLDNVLTDTFIREMGYRPLVIMLNEAKDNWHPSYPYTLSLDDPKSIFDFIRGALVLVMFVDLDVLKSMLEASDLEVEFHLDSEFPLWVTPRYPHAAFDGPFKVGLSMFERVVREFLTLESLTKIVVDRIAALKDTAARVSDTPLH